MLQVCAEKECACRVCGMPVRALVSTAPPPMPAFLPVEHAVTIQQAEDDAPSRDAHYFRKRLFLLADEAQ